MIMKFDRRTALKLLSAGAGSLGGSLLGDIAVAQGKDSVTIGWPSDVPSWDPNQRFTPDAQPIFKLVFDQLEDRLRVGREALVRVPRGHVARPADGHRVLALRDCDIAQKRAAKAAGARAEKLQCRSAIEFHDHPRPVGCWLFEA